MDSTWISSKGKFINTFEQEFSKFIGSSYAATVTNGTVALHVALRNLGIKENDEVLVPTLTYIASVNAIAYCNAKVVFLDSDPLTWQLATKEIERKVTEKTKAIVVVHLYGNSCDMDEIIALAKKYNLYVIEDCAEAIGTTYKGKHVGTFGDVSTFSFFGNKTITCGEGGMVCTQQEELYKNICKLKGQGLSEGREYWHDVIGYNYRMTNISAAIGLAQLERIEEILIKKRKLSEKYKDLLSGLPLDFQEVKKHITPSHWMFSILLKNISLRDPLRKYLCENGIETRPLFNTVHLMPMYFKGESYPIAENLSQRGINLPSYPDISDEEIEYICKNIELFFKNN